MPHETPDSRFAVLGKSHQTKSSQVEKPWQRAHGHSPAEQDGSGRRARKVVHSQELRPRILFNWSLKAPERTNRASDKLATDRSQRSISIDVAKVLARLKSYSSLSFREPPNRAVKTWVHGIPKLALMSRSDTSPCFRSNCRRSSSSCASV